MYALAGVSLRASFTSIGAPHSFSCYRLYLSPPRSPRAISLSFFLPSLLRMQGVSMMSCRRNLKKEKRVRNEACARQYRKAPKSRFRYACVAVCCSVLQYRFLLCLQGGYTSLPPHKMCCAAAL